MLIADFGFGDYGTDAVLAFLLMFSVVIASASDRSTVLVLPFFASNAIANKFYRVITSISIWGVAPGEEGLSPHNKFYHYLTSNHLCKFSSSPFTSIHGAIVSPFVHFRLYSSALKCSFFSVCKP